MKTPIVAALVVLAGLVGAALGGALAPGQPTNDGAAPASTSPGTSAAGPAGGADARARPQRAPSGSAAEAPAPEPARAPLHADAVAAAPLGGTGVAERTAHVAEACEVELERARTRLDDIEHRRVELEGEPIPPRSDVAPRFAQTGLVQTFQRAFAATKIGGRVESVDCTEHPCIVFGRLQGDEELVAALEDSEPFATYDADVGVMLTWASGDHEHEGAPKVRQGREKPPEVSLFAFAFYSHEDKAASGEAINRRIRVRTAEYWNASAVVEPRD